MSDETGSKLKSSYNSKFRFGSNHKNSGVKTPESSIPKLRLKLKAGRDKELALINLNKKLVGIKKIEPVLKKKNSSTFRSDNFVTPKSKKIKQKSYLSLDQSKLSSKDRKSPKFADNVTEVNQFDMVENANPSLRKSRLEVAGQPSPKQ